MIGFAMALALMSGPLESTASRGTARLPRYASSVSFWEGKCRYWTGDVIFDGTGFRNDLKRRFDTTMGMTIYYAIDVPTKCVRRARKLANQAGFTDVEVTVGSVDLSLP
jgi:hypothetical protein